MSNFADLINDELLINQLGDDVDYVIAGQKVLKKAIVDYSGATAVAVNAYVTGQQITIRIIKSEAPNVKRDSVFYHGATKLLVDSILDQDDKYYILAVRRG